MLLEVGLVEHGGSGITGQTSTVEPRTCDCSKARIPAATEFLRKERFCFRKVGADGPVVAFE